MGLPHALFAGCSMGDSQAAGGPLTQLHEVVDGEQQLHLLGDGLDGGGPALLVGPRDGLGVLVARVQEGAHDDVVQVPTEVGEVPVACGTGNRIRLAAARGRSVRPCPCGVSKSGGGAPACRPDATGVTLVPLSGETSDVRPLLTAVVALITDRCHGRWSVPRPPVSELRPGDVRRVEASPRLPRSSGHRTPRGSPTFWLSADCPPASLRRPEPSPLQRGMLIHVLPGLSSKLG